MVTQRPLHCSDRCSFRHGAVSKRWKSSRSADNRIARDNGESQFAHMVKQISVSFCVLGFPPRLSGSLSSMDTGCVGRFHSNHHSNISNVAAHVRVFEDLRVFEGHPIAMIPDARQRVHGTKNTTRAKVFHRTIAASRQKMNFSRRQKT